MGLKMSSVKDILDMMLSHEFLTVFVVCLLTLLIFRFFSARRRRKKHHHHHPSRLSFGDEGVIFSTILWFLVGMVVVAFAFYFLYVSLHWLQSP